MVRWVDSRAVKMGAAIPPTGFHCGDRAHRRGSRLAVRRASRLSFALLPAVGCAVACGGTVTVERHGSGGGPSDTTSTTTAAGTTTSTTTTPVDCDADLTAALGLSAACNDCSRAHCCPEAEAFVEQPTTDRYDALVACGTGYEAGSCAAVCITSLCDSDLGYVYQQACADCLNTWCCGPFDACLGDDECATGCLYDFSPACCAQPRFVTWDECARSSCSDVCVAGWCDH